MSCLDRFLGLDRDFSDFSDVSRQNRDFSISIVETNFLKLSRFFRPSRLTFFRWRDRESRSRPRRDKSRPPGLFFKQSFFAWDVHQKIKKFYKKDKTSVPLPKKLYLRINLKSISNYYYCTLVTVIRYFKRNYMKNFILK